MKKILITGSTGFLGSRLALYYKDKYELLLPTHSELNVSREEAVRAYVEEHRPDIVLHCAALSNTWYCEQHPEESHRVNVQGTVKLAKACKLIGAKFIFMLTTQVFSFTKQRSYDVCVSSDYLCKGDKVLFIDDFLANGNAAKGMIDLVKKAGAELVGMGFLIEKAFQHGGDELRDMGIHVESLAIIESLDNCQIKIKEDGHNR